MVISHLRGVPYNPKKHQFIEQTSSEAIKIDYVYQEAASEGWKQFIPSKSDGFTRSGAVRLDDSIRNYVHCILGSQAQTRSNILKSFETQQYFVDLLEQNIKSMFSIPESIDKYQDAITKDQFKNRLRRSCRPIYDTIRSSFESRKAGWLQ